MSTRPPAHSRADRLAAFDEPASAARHVDSARAQALSRLDINTVFDLLVHAPFRYVDLTRVTLVRDARIGGDCTIVGTVHEVRVKRPRPRLAVTEVSLTDATGTVVGVWFNQPWVQQRFVVGERVALAGRVELDFGLRTMKAPFVEKLAKDSSDADGRVIPVHHSTEGLTAPWLRRLIASAIDDFGDVADPLPSSIRMKRGLLGRAAALRGLHFPDSLEDADRARRRFAYDELVVLQLYMAMRRHAITREVAGVAHTVDGSALRTLREGLPFLLTDDQDRCVGDILADMAAPRPMNRLLLGDVGTGKTVVAACALAAAHDSGFQAAMMAPTEVLALQYAEKVGPLLEAAGIPWGVLTGSTGASARAAILDRCAGGELSVLFGTHALLESKVQFNRLSLAIVDEQHRFGVGQRLGLRGKGAASDLLVMTATPIPRSLALTLYGDLATSYLRSRPNAASGVVTKRVKPHQAAPAHEAVRRAVSAGHQAYVVCALVDESETAQAKAAVREAERLRSEVFPDLNVGLLTGRMRPAEKAAVMKSFRNGEIEVLVSTTVIEVGVDVANATVMLIEDAERFGLAQLHQLRGRVGRGDHSGEVWLITDPRSNEAKERIAALVESSDGFELAERDLMLRGAGQVLGERQHGIPDLKVADLLTDLDLVEAARSDAFSMVLVDPHMASPMHAPLRGEVQRTFSGAGDWVSSG
ncbi:MAG: ATP-dependent DNA helicase RecG [Coriobacteriia bacterium]|nr:ATP-dependent DNA helicase RecG [Coriobacteriia bacterium]